MSLNLKKGLLAFTILFIVSFVLLSGCLGTSNTTPQTSSGEKGVSSDSNGGFAPIPAPGLGDSRTTSPITTTTSTQSSAVYTNISDRKVIMTGSVSLETSDHDKVVNSVRSIATGTGGYVESSSTWLSSDNQKQSTITIKVPATQFEPVYAQIKALGKVKSESSSGQDVTRQYIDLSARLKNSQAEEKTLSDIMGMSKNVTEVLAVEQQLFRVRGDIESTQQQLNYLGSQVDFSTITVTVSEPAPVVGYDWGIDTAFKDGVKAFIGMIGALIVLTGYLIPLILYFAIGIAILYLVLRFLWDLYKKWQNKKAKDGKP